MKEKIKKLFPGDEENNWDIPLVNEESIQGFTEEELTSATSRMKNKKAPGPDGVTYEIVKATARICTKYVLEVLNRLLKNGVYPDIWKSASLRLLEKPKKREEDSTAYRPICLMNTMGKLYEALIAGRMVAELNEREGISNNQYGFRKERSTTEAIKRIKDLANYTNSGAYQRRKLGLLTLLDVKNAFNSIKWRTIVEDAQRKGISEYLLRVIMSYLSNRYILTETNEEIRMNRGVPQGSVLGPILWNMAYDGVFELDLTQDAILIGYADDLALMVTAGTKEKIQEVTNNAVENIENWLDQKGLTLAREKTEGVIVVERRKLKELTITIGESEINTQESVKYLEVMIGRNMNWAAHSRHIRVKAEKCAKALSRLMPNCGGGSQSRRRILASVVNSMVLYAAPVWTDAGEKKVQGGNDKATEENTA